MRFSNDDLWYSVKENRARAHRAGRQGRIDRGLPVNGGALPAGDSLTHPFRRAGWHFFLDSAIVPAADDLPAKTSTEPIGIPCSRSPASASSIAASINLSIARYYRYNAAAMADVRLKRAMGLQDLVFFYLVTALSLRWIATAAAAGPSSIIIWIAGCLAYFVPLTLCVLELSSRYPRGRRHVHIEQKSFRRVCRFHDWLDVLDRKSSVLSSFALFRRRQCIVHWRIALAVPFHQQPLFYSCRSGRARPRIFSESRRTEYRKVASYLGAVGSWLPALMLIVMGTVAWFRFGFATHFTRSTVLPSFDFKNSFFWSTVAFAFGEWRARQPWAMKFSTRAAISPSSSDLRRHYYCHLYCCDSQRPGCLARRK